VGAARLTQPYGRPPNYPDPSNPETWIPFDPSEALPRAYDEPRPDGPHAQACGRMIHAAGHPCLLLAPHPRCCRPRASGLPTRPPPAMMRRPRHTVATAR